MREQRQIMGMPVSLTLVDEQSTTADVQVVFDYFDEVDRRFSTYKIDSEISQFNQGKIKPNKLSPQMREVFDLAEQTKKQTQGYFDIHTPNGQIDPSGLVKGWAILKAAELLWHRGLNNFLVEAGGDIQSSGQNSQGQAWRAGIRHPFEPGKIVKIVCLKNCGLATSGNYERGQHIYNPHQPQQKLTQIVSLSVIGPNVYEADRFATAAFAMGQEGIKFIETKEHLAGYMIDQTGRATMTSNFEKYLV